MKCREALLRIAVAAFVFVASTTLCNAAITPDGATIVYVGEPTPTLLCRPFRLCTIALPKGEHVLPPIHQGDPRWSIDEQRYGPYGEQSVIVLKVLTDQKTDTIAAIATDGPHGLYRIRLVSGVPSKAPSDLAFFFAPARPRVVGSRAGTTDLRTPTPAPAPSATSSPNPMSVVSPAAVSSAAPTESPGSRRRRRAASSTSSSTIQAAMKQMLPAAVSTAAAAIAVRALPSPPPAVTATPRVLAPTPSPAALVVQTPTAIVAQSTPSPIAAPTPTVAPSASSASSPPALASITEAPATPRGARAAPPRSVARKAVASAVRRPPSPRKTPVGRPSARPPALVTVSARSRSATPARPAPLPTPSAQVVASAAAVDPAGRCGSEVPFRVTGPREPFAPVAVFSDGARTCLVLPERAARPIPFGLLPDGRWTALDWRFEGRQSTFVITGVPRQLVLTDGVSTITIARR